MKRTIALTVCVFLMLTCGVQAKSITWDPNTEPDLMGYVVYWRDLPDGEFIHSKEFLAGPGREVIVPLSDLGITTEGHEFYVTAFDIFGNESGPSNIINDTAPSPPGGCRFIK